MKSKSQDLLLIEAALSRRDFLTEEEIALLEFNHALVSSSLFQALQHAVNRGDKEVSLALARAVCNKFDADAVSPRPECVIYCRVSTDKQALGHGLKRQMDVCREWAEQKDYRVVSIFCEVASGADRLPVRATVERIAKKRGCKIICESFDRWSRKGVEDLPPANVEMASDCIRRMEEELAKILTPFELRLVTGSPM